MRESDIFSDEINILTVGPLNLSEPDRRAITVFGEEIQLSADEFDALYILAAHAGRPLAPPAAAGDAFGGALEKINTAGNGFMRIERSPESGYIFRTSWGSDRYGSGNVKHAKVPLRVFAGRFARWAAVLVMLGCRWLSATTAN